MTGIAQGQQQDSLLFCLKVKAAEKCGLDTLSSFRMQCDRLRRVLSVGYLVDKTVVEEKVQAMYVVIALGAAALILFGYAFRRYRQVRSEATYNAEQIRRRIARRKRMELL